MTNDGWGSKWPETVEDWFDKPKPAAAGIAIAKEQSGNTDHNVKWPDSKWPIGDRSPMLGLNTASNAATYAKTLKSQGSNLVDNEQYLYFQCDNCNDILDPHTKSFAKLQEHRVNAGWHVKWNIDGMGYKVYCAKCGEKIK